MVTRRDFLNGSALCIASGLAPAALANSDASWEAYAQVAIDQAWRAVDELG